jgi:hypothetical protein
MCALMNGDRHLIWKLLEAGADTLAVTRVPSTLPLSPLVPFSDSHAMTGGQDGKGLCGGVSHASSLPRLSRTTPPPPLLLLLLCPLTDLSIGNKESTSSSTCTPPPLAPRPPPLLLLLLLSLQHPPPVPSRGYWRARTSPDISLSSFPPNGLPLSCRCSPSPFLPNVLCCPPTPICPRRCTYPPPLPQVTIPLLSSRLVLMPQGGGGLREGKGYVRRT